MSNYAIGLDVHDMSAPVSLNVKQGESGQIINISLRSGGKPYLLPSGSYAVFAGKKPDGKILWNSCQVVRDTIQYEITKQTTAVVGWLPVQIRLYSAGGKLLLTPDFVLIVDAPVAGDEEVIAVSENEITALTELVSEAATLQKAVFTAQYGTTTYAEIKAARDEGQVVLCKMTASPLVLKLHSVEQFGAHFVSFMDGYNQIWSVSTEDVWSENVDEYPQKDEVAGLVKFTAEYGVTTLDEILEAKAAGKVVVCVKGNAGAEIPLYSAGETGGRNAYFSAFLDGYNVAYFCGSAGWSDLSSSYAEVPLTVTISGTAASHSASEIIAAIKAEKIVEVNMGTERLQVTAWDESAVTVTCKKAPAPNRSGALLSCNEYTISDAKTVTVVANSAISNNFTAKAGQVVAVASADPKGPTAFKAVDVREEFIATYGTTTFAEIWDAMSANKAVYCRNGNVTLPMTACIAQSLTAEFGGATESGSVVWRVNSATWSSYNAESSCGDCVKTVNGIAPDENGNVVVSGGSGGSDYVLPVGGDELGGVKNGGNVIINADGTMDAPDLMVVEIVDGTANHNAGEIYTHVHSGGTVIAKSSLYVFTLDRLNEYYAYFVNVSGARIASISVDANGAVSVENTQLSKDYTLPVANATTLGGVKPVTATSDMTQDVGVDANGKLFTKPGEVGVDLAMTGASVGQIAKITAVDASGVPTAWEPVDLPSGSLKTIAEVTLEEDAVPVLDIGATFPHFSKIRISAVIPAMDTSTKLTFYFSDINVGLVAGGFGFDYSIAAYTGTGGTHVVEIEPNVTITNKEYLMLMNYTLGGSPTISASWNGYDHSRIKKLRYFYSRQSWPAGSYIKIEGVVA